MQDAYILRKLTGPPLPQTLLHREELLSRLSLVLTGKTQQHSQPQIQAASKLILLLAPAGYGKTTVLADFASRGNARYCWYMLDRTDSDIITFLQRLVLSIRQQLPNFGEELDDILVSIAQEHIRETEGISHLIPLLDAFLQALETETKQQVVLLFCNYQEVNDTPILNQVTNYLLRGLPPHYALVIESRAIPELEFAHLLAHNQVYSFTQDDLRFSAHEVTRLALLQGIPSLSPGEAEQLESSFDGWISGMLLGTRLSNIRLLQGKRIPGPRTLNTSMHHQQLFTYVVDSVFQRYPDLYTFLQEACILEEMLPSLCEEVLEIEHAEEYLQELERNGLFVTHRNEGEQQVYVCHQVLRDLFLEELERSNPQRFHALHQRAMHKLGKEQRYEQAIHHALQAQEDLMAARFIIDIFPGMFGQQRLTTLMRWCDLLSPAFREYAPQILLIQARVYLRLYNHTQALPLLERAEQVIFDKSSLIPPEHPHLLLTEIRIYKGSTLFRYGAYQQAADQCQQALDELPAHENVLRWEAYSIIGLSLCLRGDLPAGIAAVQKTLQFYGRSSSGYEVARLHSILANAYRWLGKLELAEHHVMRAMTCRLQMHDICGQIEDLNRLGLLKRSQGAIQEAEAYLLQALELARSPLHYESGQAYALVNLGNLYFDQAAFERALRTLEEGLALAEKLQDRYLINHTLCIMALTYLSLQDVETAHFLLSNAQFSPTQNEQPDYDRFLHDLTYSVLLLHEEHYDEALSYLTALQASPSTTEKELMFVLQIRLAACYLGKQQSEDTLACLRKVKTALADSNGYGLCVLAELRNQPRLKHTLQTHPDLAQLRTLLHLEEVGAPQPLEEPVSMPVSSVEQKKGSRLRICAMGEPAVLIDENPVTRWRMARSMELFFLLLDQGHPLRKEQIIDALWQNYDKQSNQAFHSTLFYLRKAIGEACIVSQGGTYFLNLAAHYASIEYDVELFQEHFVRGKQLLEQEDEEGAQRAFEAMLALYRGDYVQTFYNDWSSSRRNELRQESLDAHRELALIAWHHEKIATSMKHWQQILASDNTQEEAHYGLMRCYVRQGKRSLALRQYRQCEKILQEELGARPGPTLQQFYQRLNNATSQINKDK